MYKCVCTRQVCVLLLLVKTLWRLTGWIIFRHLWIYKRAAWVEIYLLMPIRKYYAKNKSSIHHPEERLRLGAVSLPDGHKQKATTLEETSGPWLSRGIIRIRVWMYMSDPHRNWWGRKDVVSTAHWGQYSSRLCSVRMDVKISKA